MSDTDGPGVNPRNGTSAVATFDYNSGAKAGDGLRQKLENVVGLSTSEQFHQELVGGRTMKPPI